jgi:hypothetical protein
MPDQVEQRQPRGLRFVTTTPVSAEYVEGGGRNVVDRVLFPKITRESLNISIAPERLLTMFDCLLYAPQFSNQKERRSVYDVDISSGNDKSPWIAETRWDREFMSDLEPGGIFSGVVHARRIAY